MQPRGRIGPYRLLRELGRGAMGAVFLAEREGDPRPVALKVLLEAPDSKALARFQLEAAVATKLRHPGIVGVLDVGLHQGLPYLVLEYCPGQTLGAWLRSNPHPELREAVELVAQLARAAGFAHRQGVLHRDLKPANVILAEPDGRPRITDFGVARDRSLQRSMTRTGDVLGTPAYMAPEQLLGLKELDARADVYSLGVILYLCLTGRRPYEAPSVYALVDAVVQGGCPSPAELADVPPALAELCLRALAADVEQRPADGVALAEALEAWVEAAEDGRSRPVAAWVPWVLGLVSCGALAVAGAVWLGGEAPPPPAPAAPPTPVAPPPPAPVEPPPPAVSAEELAPLEHRILELFAGAAGASVLDALERGLIPLELRAPDDPRLRILRDFVRLARNDVDPLQARRSMVAALDAEPRPSDVLAALTARLCYALGFQRAATDVLRARVGHVTPEQEALPPDWTLHTAIEDFLLCEGPVRDPVLARRLCLALLARRARRPLGPDALVLPDTDTTRVQLALARALLGENALAARELREQPALARLAPGFEQVGRAIDPEVLLNVQFGMGPVLGRLDRLRQDDPRQGLSEGRTLAQSFAGQGLLDEAALAGVAAARAAWRARQHDTARALLEAAARVEPLAPDVQALVDRLLARALLREDPARAEVVAERALEAPQALSAGERADAWALIARARHARGDVVGSAVAVQQVADQDPLDRRELASLEAGEW